LNAIYSGVKWAYVMERGRIAIEGPPAEPRKNERMLAAYLA